MRVIATEATRGAVQCENGRVELRSAITEESPRRAFGSNGGHVEGVGENALGYLVGLLKNLQRHILEVLMCRQSEDKGLL